MSIGLVLMFLRMSERYFWFHFKVMLLNLVKLASEEDLKKIQEAEEVLINFLIF